MKKILTHGIWSFALFLVGCVVAENELDKNINPLQIEATITLEAKLSSSKPTPTIEITATKPSAITPSLSNLPQLGEVYYVATTGNDSNFGSIESPFKTFKKALSVLTAGDTLLLRGGVYSESMLVDISGEKGKPITVAGYLGEEAVIDIEGRSEPAVILQGNHLQFSNITVRNSARECIQASGNYQMIWGLTITDCFSSGIQLSGGYIEFYENKVFGTVRRNEGGNSPSWNSAVKVPVGGHDFLIRDNEIFANWGEGIAVTRGKWITVRRNTVYDNWATNVYIDNSFDILVEKNFSYCTENAPVSDDGYPANAYAIGEEAYEGWGAQLARVTIVNNIGAFCKRGMGIWSAEVPGGGLDTILIVNNTFWGSRAQSLGVYVSKSSTKMRNSMIVNNIFYQAENNHGYIEDVTGIMVDYNFWVGERPKDYKRILGMHDIWGNVGLKILPGYTPESFILGSESKAIGQGLPLSFVLEDFFGNARDQHPDMGAFERN